MVENWHPSNWRLKAARQLPIYTNHDNLSKVYENLAASKPLTSIKEIETLKENLVSAACGNAFLIQAGDCAEHFSDADEKIVSEKVKLIKVLADIFHHATGRRVVSIARIAGQYAKPRSQAFEMRDNITLPSYRGDLINSSDFHPKAREADPQRMEQAYFFARQTLSVMRENNPHLFASHEALLLPFEEAMTRYCPVNLGWYNLSTHFPWVGMRTAMPHEAHIEYLRGIRNPVGVKIGITMTPSNLAELVRQLNPQNELGRLVLIHRLGVNYVQRLLPQLLRSVQKTGLQVLWMCDPMHGNTFVTQSGIKTRHFDDIVKEFSLAQAIHRQAGIPLAGLHCEMTHESVTECMGGELNIREEDLNRCYKSLVDPRLDPQQAIELVKKVAQILVN